MSFGMVAVGVIAAGSIYSANRASSAAKAATQQQAQSIQQLASSSDYAAELGHQLGRAQLDENRRQYDLSMAVSQPIINKQAALMDQAKAQGDDYYDYNTRTFRPIEQELADEARSGLSRYDTNPGVRAAIEQEATRAAADTASAATNTRAQNERAMASMGVNPNSGRFAAMKVGEGLGLAAARAGAKTQARQRGIALDYAKRLDVTGMGRGLPGASQGAYGIALNAGNSAVANQNASSAQLMNGMNAGNGLIMQGQGMRMNGLNAVMSGRTSMANAAQSTAAAARGQAYENAGTFIGMM